MTQSEVCHSRPDLHFLHHFLLLLALRHQNCMRQNEEFSSFTKTAVKPCCTPATNRCSVSRVFKFISLFYLPHVTLNAPSWNLHKRQSGAGSPGSIENWQSYWQWIILQKCCFRYKGAPVYVSPPRPNNQDECVSQLVKHWQTLSNLIKFRV